MWIDSERLASAAYKEGDPDAVVARYRIQLPRHRRPQSHGISPVAAAGVDLLAVGVASRGGMPTTRQAMTLVLYTGLMVTVGTSRAPEALARNAAQPSPIEAAVSAIVQDVLRSAPIAGVSVAVGRGDRILFAKGFGLADRATGQPLDSDAVMDIGSIGKQVTAAAVLRLVENGRVNLDERVTRYLPAWSDGGRGVTVRQLLQHTSGMEDPPFSEEHPEPRFLAPVAFDGYLAHLSTAPFRFQPRESWSYANAGYQLLGLMLERLHGKAYGRVIEDTIARPAKLGTLRYCDKAHPIANRVRDYYIRDGNLEPIPPIDVSWFGGAGSLCASASDLVRWEQALWSGKVVTARLRDAMHGPATLHAGAATVQIDYGFGRAFGAVGGHRKVAHPGTGAGISAVLTHYPDDDLIVAVLMNSNGPAIPHARDVEARVAAALLRFASKDGSLDVPVTSAQTAAWTGTYYSGSFGRLEMTFTACQGNGLCATTDRTNPPRPLRHRGDGVFAGPQGPGSELRFAPASGAAQWVVQTLYGVHDNVLRRLK